jgi:MFS family permease
VQVGDYSPTGRFEGTIAACTGEELLVLDSSHHKWLLVRKISGEEGWVPRDGVSAALSGSPRLDAAGFFGLQERHWVLGCLCCVFACEWIDRSLLLIALESIKTDLLLTDTAVGTIASVSYAVGAVVVIPIGHFADQTSRRDVIAVALTVWALGTVLSGFSNTFFGLFCSRMLVGLGTAGFYPVAEASIADFFPPTERGRAYGMFGFALTLGYLIGFMGGGWLIETHSWQTTFIMVGTPQLGVGVLIHLTVPSVSTPRLTSNLWTDLRELWKLKTLRAVWAGWFFSTLATAMNKFQPSFYQRVHGLSVAETGAWLGIGTGVLVGISGIFLGAFVDFAYNLKRDSRVWFGLVAIGVGLSMPMNIASLLVGSAHLSLALCAVSAIPAQLAGPGQNCAQMAVVRL